MFSWRTNVKEELDSPWKEVAMTCFKILCQHFTAEIEIWLSQIWSRSTNHYTTILDICNSKQFLH